MYPVVFGLVAGCWWFSGQYNYESGWFWCLILFWEVLLLAGFSGMVILWLGLRFMGFPSCFLVYGVAHGRSGLGFSCWWCFAAEWSGSCNWYWNFDGFNRGCFCWVLNCWSRNVVVAVLFSPTRCDFDGCDSLRFGCNYNLVYCCEYELKSFGKRLNEFKKMRKRWQRLSLLLLEVPFLSHHRLFLALLSSSGLESPLRTL
ncbi:hypothetical protein M5K25_021348 [Dendrobium thyrsiflorum]|uniref:Uncharacterized protein n=1 Tax=Dendrobium thyrsiflorum TaxID=117978 RepID=A0ABD0UJ47_DENTH